MLLEKITDQELNFMFSWHTSECMIETLFSNFDNLTEFDYNKNGFLRLYQIPMISHEAIIDEEILELNKKQQFTLRKNVGEIYNFGARKTGKTLCTELLDIPLSMLYDDGWPTVFSSIDLIHLSNILDQTKLAIDNHPILKLWKRRLRAAPQYKFEAKNGWSLSSVNMHLASKSPGKQWFGHHVKKVWIEETSFETFKVNEKRKDALSEFGAIFRLSGMTNFTKNSPCGKIFYDPELKSKLLNLPQYVNPYWDEKEKKDRIKQYGGEDSINFKIFVKGEVVGDGNSEFDMERVRENYNENKIIKRTEITKDRFKKFKDFIIVDRPKNADRIFIAGDIGESAGSDIIILSEVEDKYIYLYNIVLYNLKHDEQFNVFNWLIDKLQANIVAIDCGDGLGRSIYRDLEKSYSSENLVWYDGSKKMDVDFEIDDNKKVKFNKGKPVYKQEYMSEFSIRRLKHLLYNNRCILPVDHKLDSQLNSVISFQTGTRVRYACPSETGDHLFDAFKVFSIAQFLKKDFNRTPNMRYNWGIGVMGKI